MPFDFLNGIEFAVNSTALWVIFAVILVFYVVMTWIFMYHWARHGHGKILFIRSIYFVVTVSLLILILVSIILYNNSI